MPNVGIYANELTITVSSPLSQLGIAESTETPPSSGQNELTPTNATRPKERDVQKRPAKPTRGEAAGLQELNSFTKTVNQTMQNYHVGHCKILEYCEP